METDDTIPFCKLDHLLVIKISEDFLMLFIYLFNMDVHFEGQSSSFAPLTCMAGFSCDALKYDRKPIFLNDY